MNKELLLYLLNRCIIEVTFIKKDGTQREMLCTLKKDIIPEVENIREKPDDLITVWDIEHKGWRSFYVGSILSVLIALWMEADV